MNAYLFTGWISQFHKGHLVDACHSLILYGGEEETSREAFDKWLLRANNAETPVPTKIEKVVGVPVLDQLVTEDGNRPIDWMKLREAAEQSLHAAQDDMEQGYWVDCNEWVRPGQLSSGIESLKQELPEDIGSGLNWSPDKSYYFLISVLSPPAPVRDPFDDEELMEEGQEHAGGETGDEFDSTAGLVERQAAFPELVEKELAALVQARNSVAAAWLWRKHAASTPLAAHAIRIDCWCGALPFEETTG